MTKPAAGRIDDHRAAPSPGIVAGTPCWAELVSSDICSAQRFYGALFGWTFQDASAPGLPRGRFLCEGRAVAGVSQADLQHAADDLVDRWLTFMSTPDVQAAATRATQLGGRIVRGPTSVGRLGAMVVVLDPVDALVGLWEPGTTQGFAVHNEHDAAGWHELYSTDIARSVTFYEKLLGWDLTLIADTDAITYLTASVQSTVIAGLVNSDVQVAVRPHTPDDTEESAWSLYFTVSEIDATLRQALTLGGTVITPRRATPFTLVADLTDPMGARFKVQSRGG